MQASFNCRKPDDTLSTANNRIDLTTIVMFNLLSACGIEVAFATWDKRESTRGLRTKVSAALPPTRSLKDGLMASDSPMTASRRTIFESDLQNEEPHTRLPGSWMVGVCMRLYCSV
jgi:hypothetical protein